MWFAKSFFLFAKLAITFVIELKLKLLQKLVVSSILEIDFRVLLFVPTYSNLLTKRLSHCRLSKKAVQNILVAFLHLQFRTSVRTEAPKSVSSSLFVSIELVWCTVSATLVISARVDAVCCFAAPFSSLKSPRSCRWKYLSIDRRDLYQQQTFWLL